MLADVSSSARGGRSSAAITCFPPRSASARTLMNDPTSYTSVPVHRDAIERLQSLPALPIPLTPTPVEELARVASELRSTEDPRLLIKRDDAIPFGFGGNKIRK